LKTDKTAKGIASSTPCSNTSAVMSKQFGLSGINVLILKELIERKQARPRLIGLKFTPTNFSAIKDVVSTRQP
jgi:hypothetical protein